MLLADGQRIEADSIITATGSRPRPINRWLSQERAGAKSGKAASGKVTTKLVDGLNIVTDRALISIGCVCCSDNLNSREMVEEPRDAAWPPLVVLS
ncbi:MAG TPA: hypothetical protein VLJ79_13280 [Candidatus Binatia bacterium]|nr:hypothetical protein [Candidatus Binatia bacterium]